MNRQRVINKDGFLNGYMKDNSKLDKNEKAVKFIACGDTGPVRKMETVVLEKGGQFVLGAVDKLLSKGDIVFANLEAIYSKRGKSVNKIPTFRLSPDAFRIIRDAHINVVSLANNHVFDYGYNAFEDTIKLLEMNNIKYFGAGKTEKKAKEPAMLNVNGIRFGFIGFNEIDNEIKRKQIEPSSNGTISQFHCKEIVDGIKKIRHEIDWLILSLHFGWEYKFYPSPKDVKNCREFIDAGADIILGHHPHYPQGLEKYKNGLIVYSLGNFIWDQKFVGHTSSSYLLEINLDKRQIHSVRVMPFELTPDYKLRLIKEKDSFNEINDFSTVLIDQKSLNEEWYFVCRNKYLELINNLWEIIYNKNFQRYSVGNWFRKLMNPRAIYTWKSLLIFILSFRAFKYEINRRFCKRRFQK